MSTTNVIITELTTYEDGEEHSRQEIRTETIHACREEPFVKMYARRELPYSMICVTSIRLFELLTGMMGYASQGQRVHVNKETKATLMAKLGVSLAMLNKCLSELLRAKLIIRVTRGTYAVNPWYASCGTWSEISTLRQTGGFDVLTDECGNDTLGVG